MQDNKYHSQQELLLALKKDLYKAATDFDKSQVYLKLLYLLCQNNKNVENDSANLNQQIFMFLDDFFATHPNQIDIIPADEALFLFAPLHQRRLMRDNKARQFKRRG